MGSQSTLIRVLDEAVAMATYQCLFFMDGRVGYWENVGAGGDASIGALLEEMLAEGDWNAAEAWRDDVLVCRVRSRVGSFVQ
jgi:hypothetical protein